LSLFICRWLSRYCQYCSTRRSCRCSCRCCCRHPCCCGSRHAS